MHQPAVTGSYWAGRPRESYLVANSEEHATQLPTRDRPSRSARYARPVLAGLLLLVALAGVRAARPTVTGTGPWQKDALPLAGALEFVLAVLLGALWLTARRRPRPGYPAAVLRAGLLRAMGLGMAGVAALAGLSLLHPHPGHRARPAVPGKAQSRGPRVVKGAAAHNAVSLTYILYGLLALLLLAAIVACVLAILRRGPAGSAGDLLVLPADDDASMRDAIESGRRALRSFDDAQAAIIACYVAMEASLASAGTTRDLAETPDELLARAAGSGLLQGTAAGRLTALFYEARYSSHALPATARDAAVRALDEISAELARRDEGSKLSGTSSPGAAP
jgi:hypothetical protein